MRKFWLWEGFLSLSEEAGECISEKFFHDVNLLQQKLKKQMRKKNSGRN